MGLFNRLRHKVIDKLIRPEDGYVYVGLDTNEPIRFCRESTSDKYWLGMQKHYLMPTLTGWKDRTVDDEDLHEINFSEWIYGILDNLSDEYSKRLDSLSTHELNMRRKEKKGDKLVINKQSFCNIMKALEGYCGAVDDLEDVLNVQFDNNFLAEIIDGIVDALEEDLEPEFYDPYADVGNKEPLIMRWLIMLDAGRSSEAMEGIDGHPLSTAEELYDYLVWKRENTP